MSRQKNATSFQPTLPKLFTRFEDPLDRKKRYPYAIYSHRRKSKISMSGKGHDPALDGSIQAKDPTKPLLNFSPGPAPLPRDVLMKIRDELVDFKKTGTSVLCYSHRSPNFGKIFDEAKKALRDTLLLPPNFEILFAHGGGHGQFSATPLNLCEGGMGAGGCVADYVVTGTWSKRAAGEASRYVNVNIVADGSKTNYDRIPLRKDWSLSPNASYRYICSNETVNGLEFREIPEFDDDVPLVVDMSSDIASKIIDWRRVGVAFACTPKNIGHSGLTVVFVRRDLLCDRRAQVICPGVLNWRTSYESGGMWNTPPTFNIYTTALVAKWILAQGGLREMEKRAKRKSDAIYRAIDESGGFYEPRVRGEGRSRMNVPFRIADANNNDCTNEFLRGAYRQNMVGFRTKTPFGVGPWLRASLYTGTSVSEARALAGFMREFAAKTRDTAEAPGSSPPGTATKRNGPKGGDRAGCGEGFMGRKRRRSL